MSATLWKQCLDHLEGELSAQQFNTWIRPLHAVEQGGRLQLLAPNGFVRDWVEQNLRGRIGEVLARVANGSTPEVVVLVGSRAAPQAVAALPAKITVRGVTVASPFLMRL